MGQPVRTRLGWEEAGEESILSGIRRGVLASAASGAVALMASLSFGWAEAFRSDSIAATVLVVGAGLSVPAALSGAMVRKAPFAVSAITVPAGALAAVAHVDGIAALADGVRPTWTAAFCPWIVSAGVLGLAAAWLVRTHGTGDAGSRRRLDRRVLSFENGRRLRGPGGAARAAARSARNEPPGRRASGLEVVRPEDD